MAGSEIEHYDGVPGFSQLSPKVWLREPEEKLGSKSDLPRQTIILLFWMNASFRYAGKYISEYVKAAAHARIVCVTTSSADYLSLKDTSRRVMSAVDILRSSENAGDRIFFHIFSNGGTLTLHQMAMEYAKQTGKVLPMRSIIIDSAPGRTSLASGYRAFSYALPKQLIIRILGACTIWVTLVTMWIYGNITRTPPVGVIASRTLNNPDIINLKAQRCYIYSEMDDLIPFKDVEAHADEASNKGWLVSKEKFDGSPHVGHMRLDPVRYWNIVFQNFGIAMEE